MFSPWPCKAVGRWRTRKDLDHLNDELGQAALYASGPDKKRFVAVLY